MKRSLGTCYYPEHWPEEIWTQDAKRMADMGLSWVRIGEFSWAKLEPSPGQLQWDWLDRAIDVLGRHGLRVVLGTPTANTWKQGLALAHWIPTPQHVFLIVSSLCKLCRAE